MDPAEVGPCPTEEQVRRICHRNFGVGSDGILFGPVNDGDMMRLRILNPDGSEAEKSGNGIRIFSRYLWDIGRVQDKPFQLQTLGGLVESHVYDGGKMVRVEMGHVSFSSSKIPVVGEQREVLNEQITVAGESLTYSAATIGNPHCVIVQEHISPEQTCKLGKLLEHEPRFPNRTNVQFVKVLDRSNIQIEIWERGAGYTLASGSSSSAAAAVSHRLGLVESNVQVHMPGGVITIEIRPDYSILMTGEVTRVCDGEIVAEVFSY